MYDRTLHLGRPLGEKVRQVSTMNSVENISRIASKPESLTADGILELYDATLDELQNCASIKPAANVNGSDVENKEGALLVLEENILNAAASVRLRGNEDLQKLIDVWEKASFLGDTDVIRPADRIAMNIFRHLFSAEKVID